MNIERATPEQSEALTKIAFAAKRHWNYPESWISQWAAALTISPDYVAKNLVFAAEENGIVSGFYSLVLDIDSADLDHLWIDPQFIGGGLGRTLFEHAVETARSVGATTLTIESEPNAEGFYQKMGAVRVGETVTEIEGKPRVLPNLVLDLRTRS